MMNLTGRLMRFFKAMVAPLFLGAGVSLILAGTAFATTTDTTFTAIASNVGTAVTGLAQILQDVSLVAGIGFILVSFFKFHQHKMNPTQVPLSQGITLLVIGAALTIFPHLITAPATALLGKSASISQLNQNTLGSIIGGSSAG